MLRQESSESGQVLILFVALFSVVLGLAAFAMDQGYWYGQRRVAQKDADLAARAGALAYLKNVSSFDLGAAEKAGRLAALDNGVPEVALIPPRTSSQCPLGPLANGSVIDGAPSLEIGLESETRGFFSSLPFVGGDSAGIQIGARSTACVGSVTGLRVVPDPWTGRPQGLIFALDSNVRNARSCFDASGELRLGQECRIFSRAAGYNNLFGGAPNSGERCNTPYSRQNMDDDIEDGVPFKCVLGQQLDRHDADDDEYFDAMHAMGHRLSDRGRFGQFCSQQEPNPDSFGNAFGNADGFRDTAPDPAALGGDASPGHVYVQNDCFDNPRVVVMPIISGGSTVTGFASAYITGCYSAFVDGIDPPDPQERMRERERDACNYNFDDCDHDDNDVSCRVLRTFEVRAIPISRFFTTESVDTIEAPRNNAPLTIQTVQ